jgi:hypothetical protein
MLAAGRWIRYLPGYHDSSWRSEIDMDPTRKSGLRLEVRTGMGITWDERTIYLVQLLSGFYVCLVRNSRQDRPRTH